MMKILYILALSMFVTACSSEVDKCVTSQVNAWEAEQQRLRSDIASGKKKIKSDTVEYNPYAWGEKDQVTLDERTKVEVEASERARCMVLANEKR